jgi:hypothetical protein
LQTGSTQPLCETPGHCWLEIVNALASGDVATVMTMPRTSTHPQWDQYFHIWSYHLSFFVVVLIILLNVVFGIIIDTFSELRGVKAAKKAHMENVCFICGIDRVHFETKGEGFDRHIHTDHRMWDLVRVVHAPEQSPSFASPLSTVKTRPNLHSPVIHASLSPACLWQLELMIQIRERPTNELTGWETYIAAKMESQDVSFMPRNAAMVLQATESRAEAAAEERLARVEADLARLLEGQQRDNQLIKDLLTASGNADTERRPPVPGRQRSRAQQA